MLRNLRVLGKSKHFKPIAKLSFSCEKTMTAEFRLSDAINEAERCLLCTDAPCAKACPAATQPDKFLRQLRFDNVLGAAETILDNNPLGGVCGTVCPVSKLCEGACTRKVLDGPVKIGSVQSFLHAYGMSHNLKLPPVLPHSGHKSAVIGAGPGGLAAARELARKGSAVTVFEKRSAAGGALRYSLSPLRLDHDLIDQEVARIQQMGVKFIFNSAVTDVTDVLSKGYDAIFVSPGLQISRQVTIKNDFPNKDIFGALSFLESANTETRVAKDLCSNKHVVIIGGGSVAMDCAITAKSFGANSVHIVAREKINDLPADVEEINLARAAGAVFHPECIVESINDNNVVVLKSVNMNDLVVGEFHGSLQASTIIVAAGQLLDEAGKCLISNSKVVSVTNLKPSVAYSGGDAIRNGGETVVRAVADGKLAASQILPDVFPPLRIRKSLETEFCGIKFENPFCLSSSPVTNSAEMIARAYDAGFAGSYYKTLNREDKFVVNHPSPRLGVVHGKHTGMDIGIQNLEQISDRPLADNLKDIEWLRVNYPNKITGVSIMGYCNEDWEYLAAAAEGAGAHLLELNFSCPQMARSDAGHHVGQQFDLIRQYTEAAKRRVKIPVIAKLTPNITDMIPAALAAQNGGADGISTINTLKSISHVDLDLLQPLPNVQGLSAISGFSGKGCRPFGLRFVSELAREEKIVIPISGMGGIYTWKDATEYLAVGASNIQVTTSVMQHGVRIVEDMINGLQQYMDLNNFHSTRDIIGRANQFIVQPSQLDSTKTEVVSVIDPKLCIGCGQCDVACRDGAAHAISMTEGTGRKANVDTSKCVGCKLCQFVCPVGAISFETRSRITRDRFHK